MAREHETTSKQHLQQQKWGTLEELLLACAVNRHGTKSWDSIAMEVANRSSSLAAASLTPQNCKDKFNDLKRRFMSQNDAESASLVPLVDRLRQIRVQELRAEVQRRDVSIVSLELKVKRLEEERERNLKEETDLERGRKAESAEIVVGKSSAVDGEGDSDERENRSYNESNSTTQKAETTNKKQNDDVEGEEEQEKEPEIKPKPEVDNEPVPIRTASEPDREDRDWSSNGRLNENENGNENADVKDEEDDEYNAKTTWGGKKNERSRVGGVSESNELWDESKREGKQSSDVQSSASLSRSQKRRRGDGDGAAAGCSSGEDPDVEGVSRSRSRSPARKKVLAINSEPLVKVLGIIRSHRLGSHFERRLRSQESERYKKLIRQHIDLRTIQSRLDRGTYSDCFHKFFRDLLLLFNNFIIFFRKSSQEYAAAKELRALLVKEMNDKLRKPKPITVKPKTEPQQHQQRQQPVSLSKPNRATIVVCGKRSAIKATTENNANANANANANSRRGDKKEREVEEKTKVVVYEKRVDNSFAGTEEKGGIKKKRSKERSVSGRGDSRSGNNKSDGGEVKHQYGGNELSSHDGLGVKNEYSKKESAARKKQGAAIFLRRMKQNSSPNKVVEDDNDDDDDDNEEEEEEEDESKDSKVEEEKKRRSSERKKDVKRERVTRTSRGRGMREESGRTRRGVGRPPKRSEMAAVAATKTTGKRGRDNGQSEVGGGGGGSRSRKRTRR